MSKSLFYQFNSALDMCFVLHFDKHSDKHNPQSESDHIIKSLSAKSNLKDFAHDFAAFIKSKYGVKQVKQITPDMCQSYIERKSAENCSLKTIKTYQSNLLKLSKCANKAATTTYIHCSITKNNCNKNTDKKDSPPDCPLYSHRDLPIQTP